jgi:hypothetical protein
MVGCPAVRPWAIALLACLACAAPAAAAETTTTIPGAAGPGPSKYDKVFVTKFGPKSAKRVLVLMPGYYGGAGDFTLDARELVKRVPGLQVWAVDRRSEALEDTSRFKDALAGRISVQQALDYYLGWLTNPAIQPRFQPLDQAQFGFAKQWGLSLALQDVRRVVLSARRQGKHVILGGHSLGASMTVAYASWDFGGHPGYEDLDGLVLIDGGLAAFGPQSFSARQAREGLAEIRAGKLFTDPLGSGVPEAGQIFAELVALHARRAPQEPSPIQANPLVPAALRPAFPVTNEAFLGYVFDDSTSPPSFASLQVRAGGLAATGDPRGWVGGQATRIGDLARAFSREPGNAAEWYYPQRLVLDTSAANALRRTPAGDVLGLRLFHTREIALPLYAFQTSLTGGGVLRGARTLIARSRIRRATLIDASATTSHLDPVLGDAMLPTVVPFIRRAVRGG